MAWNDRYRIGNGEKYILSDDPVVYRGYSKDCDITMTEERFEEDSEDYTIYFATNLLSDISFTPETYTKQDMSDYYFTTLDVRLPRKEVP